MRSRPGGGGRRTSARVAMLVSIGASVVLVDQLTKSWAVHALSDGRPEHVLGPVNLVLTKNSGAAFSLGSGVTPLIELVAIVLVLGVLWQSGRLARGGAALAPLAGLSLLAGGALSNLGDRLLRANHGAVIDFIQLVSWWPVFNVADVAVTVGALTVAVSLAFPPAGGAAHLQPDRRPGVPAGRGARDDEA